MSTAISRGLSAAFVSAALAALPPGASAEPIRGSVPVMLQDDARVPAGIAAAARAEVVRLFELAGIDVVWVTHVPTAGIRLRVIAVVAWEPREGELESVLGLNYGKGTARPHRSYVFWRRVERASLSFRAALHNVLAVAIAHELGHLLLPDGSHDEYGIMAASWNRQDVGSASAGRLQFSRETAALMRRRLSDESAAAASARPE